jgi:hypothetical protein
VLFPLNQQEVSDGLPMTLSRPPPPRPHPPPVDVLPVIEQLVMVGLLAKLAMPLPAIAWFSLMVQLAMLTLLSL